MKRYMRWLLDPCFHLLVIGLVLFQLGYLFGSETDRPGAELELCSGCNLAHGPSVSCPMTIAKVTTVTR